MIERARRAWWQRTATASAECGRDIRFGGLLLVLVLAGLVGEAGQALVRAAVRCRRRVLAGGKPPPTP